MDGSTLKFRSGIIHTLYVYLYIDFFFGILYMCGSPLKKKVVILDCRFSYYLIVGKSGVASNRDVTGELRVTHTGHRVESGMPTNHTENF